MKSFDEMADDFVAGLVECAIPDAIADRDQKALRIGYMAGLNAGIKFCGDAFEPLEESPTKEARGL